MRRYVCSKCGWISDEADSKPEDQIYCPKCQGQMLFWKRLEREVKTRR